MFVLPWINKLISHFLSPEKYARYIGVNLGQGNYIPDKSIWSSEPYLITIGNNCQITKGCRIFTHGGGQIVRDKYPDYDSSGKVIIGNYVYIGNNSLIMPGVTIGNHVLIAAGSVVTKSIPDNVIVGGNPARFICTIDEYIQKNLKYNTHSKGLISKDKKYKLLNLPEAMFVKKGVLSIKNR